ncbi:hypothetical protein DWX59_16280 [Enterocloster aldenensis]|uniref:hypothetical protein n=1 Tax=Enterocloster aldenensis TaxID=358742 RepID=UPI000E41C846|nr:hypothetical protein DWX59_16280 [Enterocloster aldenensis]
MSIKLSDLIINIPETIGETVLLVEEPRPYFNYVEGVKGAVAGTVYTVLSPCLNYEKQTIKVPNEITPSVEYKGTPADVSFRGLTGKAYQDFNHGGAIKLSVTADSISLVEQPKLKLKGSES